MKYHRVISVFDNKSEQLVKEINVNHVPLENLLSLIKSDEKDPLLFNSYEMDQEKLKIIFPQPSHEFDFESFSYFLECFQL